MAPFLWNKMNLNKIIYNLDIKVTEAHFIYYGINFEFKEQKVYAIKGDTKYLVIDKGDIAIQNSYYLDIEEIKIITRLHELIQIKG